MTQHSGVRGPSVAELGGEAAVYALTAPTESIDMYTAVSAVCESWTSLHDTVGAAAWLRTAVVLLGDAELIEFNDLVLAAPNALPALAAMLEEAWSELGNDMTLRGNVALEGWTRLTLGGWASSSLALRAALAKRAKLAARGDADADVYLVRSLSAALDQWPDLELEDALQALAIFDDLESDVAFELGMALLRKAVNHAEIEASSATLTAARHRFNQACVEGNRPDAIAFATACEAVSGFLDGTLFAPDLVGRIENAASEWALGYLGEAPHWRQARSASATAWTSLIVDLDHARELDAPGWVDPTMLLNAVGRLYMAYNGSSLLAHPDVLQADASVVDAQTADAPAWIAIGARLDTVLAADANRLWLVQRWISDMTARLAAAVGHDEVAGSEDLRLAIDALRTAHARLRDKAAPPGKADASREDDQDGIPAELREAVIAERGIESYEVVRRQLQRTGGALLDLNLSEVLPLVAQVVPLADELAITRLLRGIMRVRPVDAARLMLPLMTLLNALVRIVRLTINHGQSGQRRFPWNVWVETTGGKPPEHTLADHLAGSIELITGYPTYVEVPNISGGRADVLISIGAEQFVIEVKRITAAADNETLVAAFGDQAGQYTLAGAPFAFLAVLDTTHWTSRLSLDESFWFATWTPATGAEPRPLVGMRVLADVDTPSTLSR